MIFFFGRLCNKAQTTFLFLIFVEDEKKCFDPINMTPTFIWLIAALLFFILELLTPGFVVACFGVGCLLSALIAVFGGGLWLQIVFFCIGSIGSLLFLRPLLKRITPKGKESKTGIDALMGRIARVVSPIEGRSTKGRIALDGDEWPAFAQNPSESFEVGEQVIITANDSITMFVAKHQLTPPSSSSNDISK